MKRSASIARFGGPRYRVGRSPEGIHLQDGLHNVRQVSSTVFVGEETGTASASQQQLVIQNIAQSLGKVNRQLDGLEVVDPRRLDTDAERHPWIVAKSKDDVVVPGLA